MNALTQSLLGPWSLDPVVLLGCAAATGAYALLFRARGRWRYFLAAIVLTLATLMSPLNTLATGVLFSAHMTQHILLLLIVPALAMLSLPADLRLSHALTSWPVTGAGWIAGVGSMWFWHTPQLCDAAAVNPVFHAVQTTSLLTMGGLFWLPILAPRPTDRVAPMIGVGYLFTACLACTALGILLTLTPIEVCTAFRAPENAPGLLGRVRQFVGAQRDQQIGGLLMWLPMCLVYLTGIMWEFARWMGVHGTTTQEAHR